MKRFKMIVVASITAAILLSACDTRENISGNVTEPCSITMTEPVIAACESETQVSSTDTNDEPMLTESAGRTVCESIAVDTDIPSGSAGENESEVPGVSAGYDKPTSTPTTRPTATSTPKPTAAITSKPVATSTPKPTPRATSTPKPTVTPKPTASPTKKPTNTPTPRPTATSTPRPTATSTPRPTATPTPRATATPKPTATPTKKTTNTPTPKPTATSTPRPTATPTPVPHEHNWIKADSFYYEDGYYCEFYYCECGEYYIVPLFEGEDPDREPVPAIVGVIITIHGCNITHDFDTIYEDGDPVDLNVYREYVVQPLEGTAYHSMSLDDYEPYWIYQDLDDLFNEFYETYPNGVIWGYGTGWVDDHLVGPEIVGFVG